jgi:hypothetical protein
MGKDKMSKKSKLALAAKKCRPIKSYFATKIPTMPDEAGHPSPNRNFACAVDDVVDAIAAGFEEASVFSNATKGAYFSSSSSTPSETKTALKKRPSRAKKTISYCDTRDSELEFDEDGYEKALVKMDNGKKPSYSSSSSARSTMTMASKRECSLVDKKDYATEDVPYACIVAPTDLEKVCIMADFICFCVTSYAAN